MDSSMMLVFSFLHYPADDVRKSVQYNKKAEFPEFKLHTRKTRQPNGDALTRHEVWHLTKIKDARVISQPRNRELCPFSLYKDSVCLSLYKYNANKCLLFEFLFVMEVTPRP